MLTSYSTTISFAIVFFTSGSRVFFSITSFSILLSKAKSAYICFNLRFSSCKAFSCCTWLTSMPLYFDLQLYRVALEIPNSLLTNSADTPLSNDFTARTISFSLCAFFFITLLIKQIYHFCLIILRLNYREGYISNRLISLTLYQIGRASCRERV